MPLFAKIPHGIQYFYSYRNCQKGLFNSRQNNKKHLLFKRSQGNIRLQVYDLPNTVLVRAITRRERTSGTCFALPQHKKA